MKSEFIIVAQGSAVDNATNQLSIFNIIDDIEINVQLKPGSTDYNVPINLQLVSSLLRDETDKKGELVTSINVIVKSPNGEISANNNLPIRFEPQHVRNRVRIGVTLAITGSGNFSIQIQSDKGQLMASKDVKVVVKATTSPQ